MTTHDQLTSARDIDVLYRESDKLYYELARDCGLSETAYWIMYALEVSGGSVTQRQIAGDFSYSKQTVNSALKTLEARGLVELAPAEGDRRSKLVSLTEEGERVASAWNAACIEEGEAMLEGFSESERAAFADYLARAHANLKRYGGLLEEVKHG